MYWEPIVTAICATATLTGTLFWFIVRLSIKAALADFLVQLNGTYRRTELCKEKHSDLERRVDNLEQVKETL